jgi:xylitol oxidase
MTREHNWADNYTFSAARIHRPVSVDEVRSLVARSSHVRAIGARHSFNGIADSAGDLIDLSGIDPEFLIDARQGTVTVGGGTNYGVLAAHLQPAGWALHNMASLPHVSVAGAIATGTHGSGDRLGNLSSAVAALDIVCGTGDLVTIRRGDPNLDGAVVALGALGIVTRVTLDIQPTFEMRQDAFEGLPWSTLLSDFDTVMSAGYSVSLMTSWSGPTVTRLWIKTHLERGGERATSMADLGAAPAAHPSARPTPRRWRGSIRLERPARGPSGFRISDPMRNSGRPVICRANTWSHAPRRRRRSQSSAPSASASTATCGRLKFAARRPTGYGSAPPMGMTV